MSTKVMRVGMISADFRQGLKPHIRDGDIAHIRLDGAKRIIRRLRSGRLRQRVEERGFADIGQSDDAAFESHYSSFFSGFGFFAGGFVSSATLFMKPTSSSFASNGAASAIALSIGTIQSSSALEKLPST